MKSRPDQIAKPKSRHAASYFVAALLTFVLINVGLWKWSDPGKAKLTANLLRLDEIALETGKPVCWWLSRGYLSENPPPAIMLLGSSQACGLRAADAKVVNRDIDFTQEYRCFSLERELKAKFSTDSKVFIASMPGAMISDYYIMSRALFAQGRKPKLVIMTFSPRDFMDNSMPYIGATQPFQFFSNFVDLGDLQHIAFPDLHAQFDWMMETRLPMRQISRFLADSSAALGQGLSQAFGVRTDSDAKTPPKRKLANVVFAFTTTIRPGEYVFLVHSPKIFMNNTSEYARRYRTPNPPGFAQEMCFFRRYLQYMKEQGIAVLCVSMPLMPANRAQLPSSFWNHFKTETAQVCRQYGAGIIDLSDSSEFVASDYVDSVHLNAQGGFKLARNMAERLSDDETLNPCFSQPRASIAPAGGPI